MTTALTTALNRSTAIKLIIMTIAAGIVAGCSSFVKDFDEPPNQKQTRSSAFSDARALYDQKIYGEALERFKFISTTDDAEEVVLNAKLGEICCRLMLATNPEEYSASLSMWNEFIRSISGTAPSLDFDMIDPVIVRLTTEQVKNDMEMYRTKWKAEEKGNESKQLEKQNQEVKAELSALKKKAKKADQLQRELDEVEAENRSLKEKIKALEAIDQSIQKKKSEIESPGGS